MRTRIRELRKEKGWTLQDLAEKVKTTAQTVQRLETQNMTVSTDWLERFAAVFEVDPLLLLASADERKVPVLGELGANGVVVVAPEGRNELVPVVPEVNLAEPVAVRITEAFSNFQEGAILALSRLEGRNIDNLVGLDGLVCLTDGGLVYGRIIRSDAGRFTVVPPAPGSDVWYDREVNWAAKPTLCYKVF